MGIPELKLSTQGAPEDEYRRARERFIRWWWTGLRSARCYADLSWRTRRLESELNAAGYCTRLLDEDAEHMIAIGIDGTDEAITVQSYWDDESGPGVAALFVTQHNRLSLAIGADGLVAQLI